MKLRDKQKDSAQILQLDVDSHNVVCRCAQAHVSTHSCDFSNGYFQGQEFDRILLCCVAVEGILEEELQAEKFEAHVFLSTALKMQDEGDGSDCKTRARVQILIETNSADFVHTSGR